jgi:hypothetical protein
VAHQRSPALGIGGDAGDEIAQLAAIEIAVLDVEAESQSPDRSGW